MIRYRPLLILLIAILLSCRKDNQIKTSPSPKANLEIKWRKAIVPNPSIDFTVAINPILYKNTVVFGTEYFLNNYSAPILFLDTSNGTLENYWSDYLDGYDLYTGETSANDGQFLFLSTHHSIDCINLENHRTQWQTKVSGNGPHIYTNKGYLYTAIDYDGNKGAAILRSPTDHLEWNTIYAFKRTDRFDPSFDSMGFGELANGDEVVVWKNRSYTGSADRTDIFAYNLTADSLLWRNMDMEINSGIIPLKVKDQRVFGLVKNHVFCMNLNSGDMIWIRDARDIVKPTLDFGFFAGDLHLTSDAVVFKGDSDEIIAVNQSNGALRYIRQDVTWGFEDRFSVYNGKLFFTGGYQFVVFDPEIGEVLYNEDLSHQFKTIRSRIVFDPLRPVMYFHNGKEAFCVKIPKLE